AGVIRTTAVAGLQVDIVATSSANPAQILIFQNDNAGHFTAQSPISLTSAATGVTLQDLTGDNRKDILVVNGASPGTLTTLINQSTAGGIAFAGPVGSSVDGSPVSLTVLDTNQDGKLDVVTANKSGQDVSLLLGNGDGTFNFATNTALTPTVTRSVAMGD